jgi:hypothetical protein
MGPERTTDRRFGGRPAFRAARLAVLAIALATAIACGSRGESRPRFTFDAELLDRLDAAMTELAAGRWPSWTMRIHAGQLAFRVETSPERGEEAQRRDCSAIAKLIEENVGARVPWRAEITRGGRLLKRCPEGPAYGRRVG